MFVSKTVLALVPVVALTAACSAVDPSASQGIAASDATKAATAALAAAPKKARFMPIQRVSREPLNESVAASGNLTYRGGPVLSSVKVVTVFWDGTVQFQSQINAFYKDVPNSTYYDWLSEYNTPSQQIGRGGLAGSVTDKSPPQTSSLQDGDIQAELARLIDEGSAPAPESDTLYMVYFPPGVDITQGGSSSCQVFCAYHNSFAHNGANVYYGVIPDQGGGCAGGCGRAPKLVDNVTSVSSHELVEATTDPDVGQNDLAWYDDSKGEIGDICNGKQGTVTVGSKRYTVQTEWSNAQGACVTRGQ